MCYITDEMDKVGADGVEFVSICTDFSKPYFIHLECSREDIKKRTAIPRLARRYYKLVNGRKEYID